MITTDVNTGQKMNMGKTDRSENSLILATQNTAINCTKSSLLGNENCIELRGRSRLQIKH